jgi:hypothetical protein
MDRKVTRAFAAGLFVSSVTIYGYHTFFNSPSTKENTVETFVKKETYDELEQSYETLKIDYEQTQQKVKQLQEETNKIEKQLVYILEITQGMTPSDISDKLEKAGIIEDGGSFTKFLVEKGYHRTIQIGTYKITNNMTFEQIAREISS